MSQTPKISLIMSVYNGEDYLNEAIDSVLNQTFQDWELIVINDCSTDTTEKILDAYAAADARVKVHKNEVNLRLPSSLNKALTLAQGKYVARMDADDICLPNRLEKQYEFMEANPDVALSSCRFMTLKKGVISSGGCGGKVDMNAVTAMLLVTNPVLHPGIIAKAEVIRALGYDKTFTCTEDMELWTRFVMAGHKIQILPEYLMIYRLHDKQITETTRAKQHKEVVAIQKRYYAAMVEQMTEYQETFYIHGIYFRENLDVNQFCDFYKWLKKVNGKNGKIDPESLNYAMFEILAEYKRKGISKKDLVKAMLCFGPAFLAKELPDRKRRARIDGAKCMEAAATVGLERTGGTLDFPIFSKKITQG